MAVLAVVIVAITRRDPETINPEADSSVAASSESPFEEVVQRTEEARHGVPTGVPLNPQEEHFLTGFEQAGLCVAVLLAIGLVARNLTGRYGAAFIKRFNPWTAIIGPTAITEEKSVADFALQLQVVERGHAEMARSREEIVVEFCQTAPEKLATLRNLFSEIGRSTDSEAHKRILGDLNSEISSLRERVGSLELTPAWHLASSIEKLVGQLAEKPSNITPSTLRSVAGGLLLLSDLCVPTVRKDLATNPAVRFLAVDDDPISRRAVSMSLKKVAQAPDLAENGEAALELAGRQPYDAVFLDVEMPGLDGFEVCTKLHQLETNRMTPVVFVTGHSDFESRAKSISSGGRDLIAKPFLSSEITLKAITLLLRGRLDRQKAAREQMAAEVSQPVAAKAGTKAPATKPKEPTPAENGSAGSPAATSASIPAASAEQSSSNQPTKGTGKSQPKPKAKAQRQQNSESTGDKIQDPPLADRQVYLEAFKAHGAEHLREIQEQVSNLSIASETAERHEILGELYVGLNMLRSEAARAGLRAICELTSALGKLISKLLDKPALFAPSALQAISAAIRLLEELAPGKLEPDLTDPPIRALVVDDEPLTRRAISNALQLTFGKPDNAENGQAAVALTQSKVFDVIFLDIMMPEMDGFETCAKIRETKLNGATPIIFVTSHKDTESRDKSFSCGGNSFISKPVLPAEIFLTALTFTIRARLATDKNAPSPTGVLEEAVC